MRNSVGRSVSAGIAAIGLVVLLAAPAIAAPTSATFRPRMTAIASGTLCGQVTTFTAPTPVADGSITINGIASVIDKSAAGTISAALLARLTIIANAHATACLDITANAGGTIVNLTFAASAQLCGAVAFNATLGAYSVNGVLLPAAVVNANAGARALLSAAAAGGGSACVTVTSDTTTGAILALAVTASVDVCGKVVLGANGTATVGGRLIAAPVLAADANLRSALQLAAHGNANACASLTSSVNANGTLDVTGNATVTICAVVNAVSANSLTLNGVTFALGAGSSVSSDVKAGATLTLRITADSNGRVTIVTVSLAPCSTTSGPGGRGGGGSGGGGSTPGVAPSGAPQGGGSTTDLPNTAVRNDSDSPVPLVLLVLTLLAGMVAAAMRIVSPSSR